MRSAITSAARGFAAPAGFTLGLAPKLLGVVALLAVLAGGIALGGGIVIDRQTAEVTRLEGLADRAIGLGRANGNMLSWVRSVEFLPLDLAAADRRHWEEAAATHLERLDKRISELRDTLSIPENRRDMRLIEADIEAYRPVHQQVQALARAGRLEEATRLAMASAGRMAEAGDRLREMQLRSTRELQRIKEEAHAAAAAANAWLTGGSVAGILLGAGLALAIVLRGVTGPLKRLTATAGALAEGRIDEETAGTGRGDEVGAIARGLEVLREAALRARTLEAEATAARAAAEAERRQAQLGLAERVEQALGAVAQGLAESAAVMERGIGTLSAAAGNTAERAAASAAGAAQTTGNVQTVAAAAEELAGSVGEITRQVTQAAEVARRAVQDAQQADGTVTGLSEAAQRIGDVVRLIGDIAGQTNLLALNATIEAARAGEAGKGFAVVASEVKALAGQTAKATKEIAAQVAAIQASTGHAVQSIKGIAEVVAEVDHIAAAIAAAVEEQGAATREIARNVAEAARGTDEVSANIAQVSAGVEETNGALHGLREATGAVTRQGGALREELSGLLRGLRAA